MKNLILFAVPSLIWGSTWLAIKFQLGEVDPIISIFYRFLLSAMIILVWCRYKGLNLKYSPREHGLMALQGILLFGVNYWLVYLAEQHLTSGLVAVVFATIIFLNIFNGALLLKSKISGRVVISALIGFLGVALLFRQEISGFSISSDNSVAFLLAFLSAFIASLGNITSAYNQKKKLPVVQTNAFGMFYGAALMLIMALISGTPFRFESSLPYISSLIYLALFGSVFAFTSYLTLLGKIGADRSAYVTLVIPVIALILSTLFEDYHWTLLGIGGVLLIISGNILVLKRNV